MYGWSVLQNMIEKAADNGVKIEILDEKTNFMELTYE
jgi:hypothetical protein